ncbi:MAG: OsmC family protein [Spirochaetota bacterium]
MITRKAHAVWTDTVKKGKGELELGSGAYKGGYSFGSRFEEAPGTNPEELIGAAHAGCFSMALSDLLEQAGFPPEYVDTDAKVLLDPQKLAITTIELTTTAAVPSIDASKFQEVAEQAKGGCPVSKALAGVDIKLNATLK